RAAVVERMGQDVDVGFAPGDHLAVHPDEPVAVMIGNDLGHGEVLFGSVCWARRGPAPRSHRSERGRPSLAASVSLCGARDAAQGRGCGHPAPYPTARRPPENDLPEVSMGFKYVNMADITRDPPRSRRTGPQRLPAEAE